MDGSRPTRARARILVAEDDPAMRQIVAEVLEKEGHLVEHAGNGREVLQRLASSLEVDLVVSDVRMPGVTGFQILEALRVAGRETPVILMTAFADGQMRERATRLGAVLFEKPFAMNDLRSWVGRLLPPR